MKKIVYIFLFTLFACNSEDGNDCFQTTGTIVQEEILVSNFERILVNRNIELVITEASEYKVIIETGENLLNDINVEVIANQLVLSDNNSCNFVREYGITKIYVDAPNLNEIRTSSQYEISSNGVLNYSTLSLFSEDFNEGSEFTVGDFRLNVNSNSLNIVSNNISFFYLEGAVQNLSVGFYSGVGRVEGENLIAENVSVYHRGSNDMVVNPQQSLSGQLLGTGDLISVNQPPNIDVEQIYTGELIFN
ncbi:head GIN domain-containing protein [uncultured Winogradskyella sp.]|uniref:head GIN domain-containing protein n=1 Tax=Winogradskyella sp. 4-2091 TaxID=3381659 RepID=UPI002628255C|nr:head GIN domain-containing protein [uncultured Winogradskyella sp.]